MPDHDAHADARDREWRRYEIAIADILRRRFGETATVEEDVELPTADGRVRSVEIVVRGRMFNLDNGLMVVDCKHWRRKVHVGNVGAFIDLVDDIGADHGLLVAGAGFTTDAAKRAGMKSIKVEILPFADLDRWTPSGTRELVYHLPARDLARAQAALTAAGLRHRHTKPQHAIEPGDAEIDVVRHFGAYNPDTEQFQAWEQAAIGALRGAGVEPRERARGVVISGGEPTTRSFVVLHSGQPIPGPLRFMASNLAEVDANLRSMEDEWGMPHGVLHVDIPAGWPGTPADAGGEPPAGRR